MVRGVKPKGLCQTPGGPFTFLPSSFLLFLLCSPVLVIENVFIAGPEAGLGRGKREALQLMKMWLR